MRLESNADGHEEAISRARVWLVLNQPFFSFAVLGLVFEPQAEGVSTLSTDGLKVYYNPSFVSSLPVEELAGAICHELMHNLLLHLPRRRGRVFRLWNLAADIAVNNDLMDAGIRLPRGSVAYKPFREMSAEEIYSVLIEQYRETEGPAEGDGSGGSASGLLERYGASESRLTESHSLWDSAPHAEDADASREQAWLDRLFGGLAAAKSGRAGGSVPGGCKRLVKSLSAPKVSWRNRLAETLTEHLRMEDFNPSRPNLKYLSGSLHLPSLRSVRPHLVVAALDASASISPELLEEFAGELFGLLSEVEEVEGLAFDAQVHPLGRFMGGEEPHGLLEKLEITGGGGTDFGPIFRHVAQEGLVPAALVIFTDLRGRFPEDQPGYPTIWVTPDANHAQPPFGRVVSMQDDAHER